MPAPQFPSHISSARVSLSGLSWAKTDGTPLFSDIRLNFGPERTGIVGRNGAGKTTLLRLISGALGAPVGQITISGKIALLRQDSAADPDESVADLFGVRAALDVLERADQGLASADELADADWTLPSRIEAALLQCDLPLDPKRMLATLSGGQQNRAALAALLFADPDFLLLDEPTNNLDRSGRRMVIDLIRGWKKGAIIVSHDRELLDEMDAIVELTMMNAVRYGGNYSAFRARRDADILAAQQGVVQAERARDEVQRRAQQQVERKARKDSVGRKARAKRDQPKIMMDFSKGRAESSAGDNARLHNIQRAAAEEALVAARDRIEILQPLCMDVPSSQLAPGRTVLRLDGVTGGHDPDNAVIRNMSLTVTGPEHVAIAGPNGSGKTTLINLIIGQLCPQSGKVETPVPFALLDQHVGLFDPDKNLHWNYRNLNPTANIHMAHSALARFGFRADAALMLPRHMSGGERLRAGLACVLGAVPTPMLLILDEPTNHLDLDGIAALEAALASYDGAILAVSHDEAFLKALAPQRTIQLGHDRADILAGE